MLKVDWKGWISRFSAKKPAAGPKTTRSSSSSKKLKAHWFIAGPIILVFGFLYTIGFLKGLDYGYLDFLFNLRLAIYGTLSVDPRLALAAIDEKSIQEIGSVPWPRSVYAKLLDELFRYDPALVVFDVFFTEPDKRDLSQDQALVAATAKRKNRIVHAFFERIEPTSSGIISANQFLPFEELKQTGTEIGFVEDQRMIGDQMERARDRDGAMRRTFLSKQTIMGNYALSLGARAFAKLKGISTDKFVANYPDQIQINFPGLLITYTQSLRPIPKEPYLKFSISDILRGRLRSEEKRSLKGAVIFIASTATGYYDHYPTPYNPMTPGVEIHMYALENLLRSNYLKVYPNILILILIIALGFLVAVAVERYSAILNFLFLTGIILGLFLISFYLFINKHTVFPVITPVISSFLVLASMTLYRIAFEEKEKRWIRSTFNQYLSPKVVSLLVENPDALKLGGERRLMTVFFLDIESFTSISERLPPDELTVLLNKYLTLFTDTILKYDGVVDKFIGDAVMAFWNAPFEQSQHPLSACQAALEIREKVQEMAATEIVPIHIRVGIHTGYAVVGNMGSSARFSYTAVGDSVNFASRLEGANKYFKTSLLISEPVYEVSSEHIVARELGRIRVVGKEKSVGVYELLGKKNGQSTQNDSLALWSKFMSAIHGQHPEEGRPLLDEYLSRHPQDPVAQRYHQLFQEGKTENFVINLTEK